MLQFKARVESTTEDEHCGHTSELRYLDPRNKINHRICVAGKLPVGTDVIVTVIPITAEEAESTAANEAAE